MATYAGRETARAPRVGLWSQAPGDQKLPELDSEVIAMCSINSTICWRNAAGYGGLLVGMVGIVA